MGQSQVCRGRVSGQNGSESLAEALSSLAWGSVDEESGEWAWDQAPGTAFQREALQRTETLESPDPSLEPPHSSLITCPDRGGSFTDWASWPVHRYSEYVARAYPADPTMEDKAPPWFSAPV